MKLNMKRVLLVLCMVTCLFSLSACSSAKEDTSIDVAVSDSLQQQTVGLLENIISIPADQMEYLVEQNRMAGAEAVAVGLENYLGQVDELGTYISSGEGTVTAIDGGYSVTINTTFEKRPASFTIVLDKDMVNITSMSFDPVYTTGEKLEKAAMNTLMGMGTVFIVLIFISFLIGCFKYIGVWEARSKNKDSETAVPEPVMAAPVVIEQNLVDDLELVAVITAAIAASQNTSADGLVVRSIRRAPVSRWKKA